MWERKKYLELFPPTWSEYSRLRPTHGRRLLILSLRKRLGSPTEWSIRRFNNRFEIISARFFLTTRHHVFINSSKSISSRCRVGSERNIIKNNSWSIVIDLIVLVAMRYDASCEHCSDQTNVLYWNQKIRRTFENP